MGGGTITFLFTDIEGSTRLWETHPEAMRVALARHDALLRSCIQEHHGQVFKTVGDAFCAAFSDPRNALEAALLAQQRLVSEAWPDGIALRVRMALHTGVTEQRDNDFFGPPLNRVARLLAIGHGGQTLLSIATFELVRDSLPDGVSLLGMGEHRLKDLNRPETVFQLCHPELPRQFAPLRSLDNPELQHNLPQQVTSFIGREKELEDIKALLSRSRLLTLTGSGGTGKTRLALQVAADLLDTGSDGVWLVELAPLTDPELVPQAVADALGVKEEPGKPLPGTVIESLKDKQILLILDNCEHLIEDCASLADRILRQCPHVTLLATSREGLGIAGETTYRVPSLSLPNPKQDITPESLSPFESVRLFLERAQSHQPQFAVTNQNAPALASVCYRLDGIPLAIELAAARVRSLTVEEVNAKLDQRFRLLTGGSRTALPRQQTLRSLIDWSYDLLNDAEKALLCRLSVFSGGWTLEAAEQVCTGEPVDDWEVLDLLTSLVDKSLVVAETAGTNARYRQLETVRQYAREKLHERGDGEPLRERHFAFYLALANDSPLQRTEQARWLTLLEQEYENLRAALDWSEGTASPEPTLRLCGALQRFWWTRGYLREGRERCTRALEKPGAQAPTRERAGVLNAAGALAWFQSDYAAARRYYEESLAIGQALQNPPGIAAALNNLGNVTDAQGDYAAAQDYYARSLAIHRQLGDRRAIATSLGNLGMVAGERGDPVAARTYLEESLTLCRELGDRYGTVAALGNLGWVAQGQGDYAAARAYLDETIAIQSELGDRRGIAYSLQAFAVVAVAQGQLERAAQLWGASEAHREQIDAPVPPYEQEAYAQRVAGVRATLGETAFADAWQQGRTLSLDDAVALAREKTEDTT